MTDDRKSPAAQPEPEVIRRRLHDFHRTDAQGRIYFLTIVAWPGETIPTPEGFTKNGERDYEQTREPK